MKKTVYLFLFLFSMFPGVIFPVQFLVSPPKLEFDMYGKSIASDSLVVMNRDTNNVTIKCYIRDWNYKDGKETFSPPGALKYSSSGWISINPLQFVLMPYEKKTIRISVRRPDSAENHEYRSMLFFESIAKPTKYSSGFLFNARIGIPVYVEMAPKSFSGYIGEINVEKNGILATYVNASDNRLYLNAKYRIINTAGTDTAACDSIDNELLLPGDTEKIHVNIKDLKRGEYYFYLYVDNGGENIDGGKKKFVKE